MPERPKFGRYNPTPIERHELLCLAASNWTGDPCTCPEARAAFLAAIEKAKDNRW